MKIIFVICGMLVFLLISSLERQVAVRPQYTKTFIATYEKEFTQPGAANISKCSVCHDQDNKTLQNNYGDALRKALPMRNAKDVKVIESALRDVEALPSDIEGLTFGDLIKAGRLPGSK